MRGALLGLVLVATSLVAPAASATSGTFEINEAGAMRTGGVGTATLASPAGFWIGPGGRGGAIDVRSGTVDIYSWREGGASLQNGGTFNTLAEPDHEAIPVDGVRVEILVGAQDDGGAAFLSEDIATLQGVVLGTGAPQFAVTTRTGNALPVDAPSPSPYAVPQVEWTWSEGDLLLGNTTAEGYEVHGAPEITAPLMRLDGVAQLELHDGTLVIDGRRIELGNWTETEGPGSTAMVRRNVAAIISFDGDISLGLPSSFALGGTSVRLDLEGGVRWPEATGRFVVDGTTYQVDRQAVELIGALSYAIELDGAVPAAAVATYSGEGNVSVARIDGRVVYRAAPTLGADVAIVAASTVGIALVLILVAHGAMVLYTRIRTDELLEHPTRRVLYEAVLTQPGIHLRALHRASSCAYGPFLFHLRLLEQGGYVRLQRAGGYRQVFATTSGGEARAVIPNPVARAIYEALDATGAGPTEVAARAGVSRQLASYHLKRLETAGLVRRDGASFVRTV